MLVQLEHTAGPSRRRRTLPSQNLSNILDLSLFSIVLHIAPRLWLDDLLGNLFATHCGNFAPIHSLI